MGASRNELRRGRRKRGPYDGHICIILSKQHNRSPQSVIIPRGDSEVPTCEHW